MSEAGADAARAADEAHLQVLVRARPINDAERRLEAHPCVRAKADDALVLTSPEGNRVKTFQVSRFFDVDATQLDVFEAFEPRLQRAVRAGRSVALVGYGASMSGKSYTMMGEAGELSAGLVPRTLLSLLHHNVSESVMMRMGIVLVGADRVVDLFAPSRRDVQAAPGMVRNVTWQPVSSPVHALQLLDALHSVPARTAGLTTFMTSASTVILVQLVPSDDSEAAFDAPPVSLRRATSSAQMAASSKNATTVLLAELPGSERGSSSARLTESSARSQSIQALGRVVAALRNGSGLIPYRDAPITTILQLAFSTDWDTTLVACVSAADTVFSQSYATMLLAAGAMVVQPEHLAAPAIPRAASIVGVGNAVSASLLSPRRSQQKLTTPRRSPTAAGSSDASAAAAEGGDGATDESADAGRSSPSVATPQDSPRDATPTRRVKISDTHHAQQSPLDGVEASWTEVDDTEVPDDAAPSRDASAPDDAAHDAAAADTPVPEKPAPAAAKVSVVSREPPVPSIRQLGERRRSLENMSSSPRGAPRDPRRRRSLTQLDEKRRESDLGRYASNSSMASDGAASAAAPAPAAAVVAAAAAAAAPSDSSAPVPAHRRRDTQKSELSARVAQLEARVGHLEAQNAGLRSIAAQFAAMQRLFAELQLKNEAAVMRVEALERERSGQ